MYEIKRAEIYYITKYLIHTQRFEKYEKKTNQEIPSPSDVVDNNV